MRLYDYHQAQKVTWFISNSQEVQSRIKKFYHRESTIIHPPVALPRIKTGEVENYFLTGGRLELPKNFALIVKAFNQLKLPLKIYGSGPQENYLRSIASPIIEFMGLVSEEEKFTLMAKAKAFVVAAVAEDFDITPVEAMAAGRPVIAFRGGGYLETVIEGKTGEFFPPSHKASAGHGNEPTVESLVAVLKKFDPKKYRPEDCRKQAEKFSKDRFVKEIKSFIKTALQA